MNFSPQSLEDQIKSSARALVIGVGGGGDVVGALAVGSPVVVSITPEPATATVALPLLALLRRRRQRG